MIESPEPKPIGARQIVGFSLPPEIAAAVKSEAAHRRMSLRKLFEEMWTDYRAKHNP